MSDTKYGEPWKWNKSELGGGLPGMECYHELNCERSESNPIGVVITPNGAVLTAFPNYADRAVVCVNALAGLNPEAIGELMDAAKLVAEDCEEGADCQCDVCLLDAAIAKAEQPQ